MEIKVTARQTIKPSSPTAPQFKHMKLSLIDQHMHQTSYARILLFYSAQGDPPRFQDTNMSDRLKRSLGDVLTEYYPLAGRLNDTKSIECSDDGLEYIEARVKAPLTLDQLIACPKSEELDRLLPHDVYNYGKGFRGLSAVQVTIFEKCGGMAVGVSVSHFLADASSLATFLNRWAAIARGGDTSMPREIAMEKFSFASIFPPRDLPGLEMFTEQNDTGSAPKYICKRFIFPQSKIQTLKRKFEYQRPSSVEAVSALLFKCLISVSKRRSRPVYLGIVLNLRPRTIPRLPRDYLGNMALFLMMEQISPEMSFNDLGLQLRKMIKEVDGDYLRKLQANNAELLFETLTQFTKFCINNDARRLFPLSSCCKVPFYEVNLGWGKPIWIALIVPNYPSIVLFDAKNGDGIEAWLTMEEEDMAHFELENELLNFTHNSNLVNCRL